jgi:hypothetical protein
VQGDDALQFLVDLVCYEADADVRLYPPLRKVKDGTHLQIALRDTECPFHVPKTVILGYYLFGIKVRTGSQLRPDITIPTVGTFLPL